MNSLPPPVAFSSCNPYSTFVRYGGRGSPAIVALAILCMLHAELTSRFHNVLQVVHLTRPLNKSSSECFSPSYHSLSGVMGLALLGDTREF